MKKILYPILALFFLIIIYKPVFASSEYFFEIDLENKKVIGDYQFEDLNFYNLLETGNKKEILNYLNTSGLYKIIDNNNTIKVTAIYGTKQLMVFSDKVDLSLNNYSKFEDGYIVSFSSEVETKNTYEDLIKKYPNENIFIDYPIELDAVGWGYEYTNLDSEIKKQSARGNKVIVAVADSGINKNHSIFTGTTILPGYNVLDESTNVEDDMGHGTAVAGIIAESTPSNIQILPIKIVKSGRSGSTTDMIKAVKYAHEKGASIINFSMGGTVFGNERYFNYMEQQFAKYSPLVISASGNENKDMDKNLCIPAALPSSISVGSINSSGIRSNSSNYGNTLDFVAPGQSVRVAYSKSGSTYSTATGTSFSTPYVSAIAAILKAENSSYTKTNLKKALISICTDLGPSGKDIYYGYGCPKFKKEVISTPQKDTTPKVVKKNGWIKENGDWYYYNSNGQITKNSWVKDSKGWVYLGSNGRMQRSSWIKTNNKWYYLKSDGYMVYSQWYKISGKWYWFNSSGVMQTGWIKLSGRWYYLNPGGDMATGWKKVGSTWYYLENNGIMKTGWLRWNNKWYYLNSNGAMQTGSKRIGNRTYKFSSSGICLNP